MDQELNDFKVYINLPTVAEDLGFSYYKSKSSTSTIAMKHPSSEDTFFFYINSQNKHHLYRNIQNQSENGSVIDLVQRYSDSKNLGQVRKFLRSYMNMPEIKPNYDLKPTYINHKENGIINFFTVNPLTDTSFLESRGINKSTLSHPNFKDTIGQVDIFSTRHNKTFHNTAFPIKNAQGTIGLDIRNKTQEGSFKSALAGSRK